MINHIWILNNCENIFFCKRLTTYLLAQVIWKSLNSLDRITGVPNFDSSITMINIPTIVATRMFNNMVDAYSRIRIHCLLPSLDNWNLSSSIKFPFAAESLSNLSITFLNFQSQFQTPIFQREGQHLKVAYTQRASNRSPDIPRQVLYVKYDHGAL